MLTHAVAIATGHISKLCDCKGFACACWSSQRPVQWVFRSSRRPPSRSMGLQWGSPTSFWRPSVPYGEAARAHHCDRVAAGVRMFCIFTPLSRRDIYNYLGNLCGSNTVGCLRHTDCRIMYMKRTQVRLASPAGARSSCSPCVS
jgi:hypothetical protein